MLWLVIKSAVSRFLIIQTQRRSEERWAGSVEINREWPILVDDEPRSTRDFLDLFFAETERDMSHGLTIFFAVMSDHINDKDSRGLSELAAAWSAVAGDSTRCRTRLNNAISTSASESGGDSSSP